MDIGKEYRTKRVSVFGRDVTVVLQNENGPCPLLAIGALRLLGLFLDLRARAVLQH